MKVKRKVGRQETKLEGKDKESKSIEMGFCVVIGLVAGFYADKYLGTYPYLTFVFMIFGMIAAFKAVYRAYKRLKKEDDEGDYRNPG